MKRVFLIGALLVICSISFGQTIGEYRSNSSSGTWETLASWRQYNGSTWIVPSSLPTSTSKVTIKSGDIITIQNSQNVYDLNIENGGSLRKGTGGSPSYLGIYHDLVCDGIFEDGLVQTIGLSVCGQNCSVSGSGTLNIARIRKDNAAYNSILNIYSAIISRNNSTSCLYNNALGTIFFVNINFGASFNVLGTGEKGDGICLAGYVNAAGSAVRLNIKGSMTVKGKIFGSNLNTGDYSSLQVDSGGILNAANIIYGASGTAKSYFTINSGGVLKLTDTTAFSSFSYDNNVFDFSGKVDYCAIGNQNIQATTYKFLSIGGSGTKTFVTDTSFIPDGGSFEISGTSTAAMFAFNSGTLLSVSNNSTSLIYSAGNAQTTGLEWSNYSFANLIINNASGVTVTSPKAFSGTLTLQNGNLALGDNNLTLNSISGGSLTSYIITNGTGTVSSRVGSQAVLFPIGVSASSYTPVSISNAGAEDLFTIKCNTSTSGTVDGTGVINKQWNIKEDIAGGSNLSFTFGWNSIDEMAGFNRTNAIIGCKVGSTFDIFPSSAYTGTDPYYISSTSPYTNDLSSGQIFSIGNPAALPVELSSFTSRVDGMNVLLCWTTSTEKNSMGFQIQRKTSDGEWKEAGFVNGACLSNSPKEYGWIDSNLNKGIYHYRLKMIDLDNTFTFSHVISEEVKAPERFFLSQNYPNPFNPSTSISYSLERKEHVIIRLFDMLGREVKLLVDEFKDAGNYEVFFSGSGLSTGIYIYKMEAGEFMSQKKFLFLK